MSEQWISLAKLLLPLLTVLLFMLLVCRGLTFWQDKQSRTWRNLWFALMYLSFFLLCVTRSFALPALYLAVTYLFLVVFLTPAVWCDWWDFIKFLREKNTKFIAGEATARLMTLDKLASDDVHAVLDATPVEAEGHVALEATPVKPDGIRG